MKNVIDRLLTVKSIVTIALTVVFCVLSIVGTLPQEFMAIYTMVVGFYFGTQSEKKQNNAPVKEGTNNE